MTMNMTAFKPFLLLISLLAFALVSSSIPLRGLSKGDYIPCALYLNVKTLSDPVAGTTSNVSIRIGFWRGSVTIPNLVDWNRRPQPPGYVFFQSGQLDNLVGAVDCDAFLGQPCSVEITATGTGSSPSWGLAYIEVDSPEVGKRTFHVNKWLTPENNYHVVVSSVCPFFSKGMSGSTKASLAI